jgi:hypothetical protein
MSTRQLQIRPWVNPAEGGTSDGGQIDIFGEREDATQSELQQGSGTGVLLSIKVRPEVPPSAGFTHGRIIRFFVMSGSILEFLNSIEIFHQKCIRQFF